MTKKEKRILKKIVERLEDIYWRIENDSAITLIDQANKEIIILKEILEMNE